MISIPEYAYNCSACRSILCYMLYMHIILESSPTGISMITDRTLSSATNSDTTDSTSVEGAANPDLSTTIQNHVISVTSPESSSLSILGPAVGGAVGAVIVVTVVMVVIALLFIKRGQKGSLKVNDRKESVQGYNNAVYDGKQNTQTDK